MTLMMIIKVKRSLNDRITSSSIKDLRSLTPSIVKEANKHLMSNKNDPIFQIPSECLKNTQAVLCEQLALLFRHYLQHEHITATLMLSTLIPLIKDKLGDITSSDNYRSIALSCLILKVFDWVVLLLHRDNLKLMNCNLASNRIHQPISVLGCQQKPLITS